MTGRKVLFIDRDGTINVDCPYCWKVEDLRIYEDSISIMKEYSSRGYMIVIITNQSGINRGYFTVEDMERFNSHLIKRLSEKGVKIDALYYCPHRPDEGCRCRKPGTGMIEKAVRDLEVDLAQSIMVGDRDDIDGELARRTGMGYIRVQRN